MIMLKAQNMELQAGETKYNQGYEHEAAWLSRYSKLPAALIRTWDHCYKWNITCSGLHMKCSCLKGTFATFPEEGRSDLLCKSDEINVCGQTSMSQVL